MKIQLASDLHLELINRIDSQDQPVRIIGPVPGADVLVLAGDIADGTYACSLFSDWPSEKRAPVIYVAGNHDFYGHPIDPIYDKLRKGAALNNIHFLENDAVVIEGVRFLGATLWTDYRLRSNRTQSQLMEYCGTRLNDHYRIRTGRHEFTPQDALDRHEIARAWLETELAKPFDGKTVVVSHHAPHPLSVHPRYLGNHLNAAFVSDLSDLMPNVDLWLHGHVHDSFDYSVGRCRVVANPSGYVLNRNFASDLNDYEFENLAFDPNLLVSI
ncbi:MAG: metallophosphoesterase [Rhodoferax sp.]|uniref:metallophosphoesterase n=1 Tax=Rhodoferax sp. TaxID=50421 RepID=UPI002616C3E2|nr:metallophosphoesterase [Rhodoferax sp.]MDD2881095.1 metallophosphoesterase [Rhodoferax sp.]